MWNYRVIQHTDNTANSIYYQIHEVYYDSDENPTSMTVNGVSPFGESTEELSHSMIHMMGALTKPVLDVKIFDTIERTEDTKLAVEQISKIGHKDV
jgi:hypothetical protein|tara:strand:- start:1823 stop:2110 length:288 start_codon:yes stop_codon:yes gene_type:complete